MTHPDRRWQRIEWALWVLALAGFFALAWWVCGRWG
jgi:hypothetical protein